MLFLYLRIFTQRWFRIAALVVMFICIGTAFATIMATVFSCQPLNKAWNPNADGTCIWTPGIWYASSSVNVATDLMIIALPIPQIYALEVRLTQKIGLAVMFSLSFL
jgi:hypothetical protein